MLDASPPVSPSANRSAVGVESEAFVAAGMAGSIGALTGGLLFAGGSSSILDGWSIGLLATIVVVVLGLATSYLGYRRSRHWPGQEWRLSLAPWKFALDAANVAAVHALIAGIATFAVFLLLSLSFRNATVDGWASATAVGVAAGLTSYWIYRSVSAIDTTKLSTLLMVFIGVTTLASMTTAADPWWWKYNFSLLGALGGASANLFNVSLIISGLLVTTFSLYLQRDIRALVELGVLRYRWSARLISTLFIVMGFMLASVGFFPLTANVTLHNLGASGMSIAFGILLLASPFVMRGMPRMFHVVTAGFLAGMVVSVILFEGTGYLNLTFFEVIVFMIIFGWIAVFIRFLTATLEQARATPQQSGELPKR